MRKSETTILLIILISFIIGAYSYSFMPESMASHWNIRGEVDGYMPRFWGMFLMPLLSVAMLSIFMIIPKIDPLRKNIEKFRKYFDMFIIMIILFLFYIYSLTLFWNTGLRFSMSQVLVPAFSGLFFYAGVLLENTKRNWFIGIRTPWTISSEKVWNKTNKLGGKMFKITAVVILLGLLFESLAFYLMVIPILVVSFYAVAYSYFEYQKQKK